MIINYWAILVCAVISLVLGSVWYGPLFGKKWMKIVGMSSENIEVRKRMKKSAWMLYLTQFVLSLIQVYILANLLAGVGDMKIGVLFSAIIFLGFIMPTIAGDAMWTAKPRKIAWAQFGIQFGYQLVLFVLFGLILSTWI